MAASAVASWGALRVVRHDRPNVEAGCGGPEAVRRPVDGGRWRIDAVVCAVRPIG
ncbi:MAG: hypothetical protein WCH74_13610 [Chloroflexota bacterium]